MRVANRIFKLLGVHIKNQRSSGVFIDDVLWLRNNSTKEVVLFALNIDVLVEKFPSLVKEVQALEEE